MLTRDNFTEKHIRELQNNSKRDPILIERKGPYMLLACWKLLSGWECLLFLKVVHA